MSEEVKNENAETENEGAENSTVSENDMKNNRFAEKRGEKENKKEEKEAFSEAVKEVKRLTEENGTLTEELSALNDKYTRMLAEYDNFRKRAQKEREGIYADATADVLGEILPVKDSLEMALKYADDSQLSQGVTMTLNKFSEILRKIGVEEFGAEGEEFDPNLHNAVFHIEDESLGESVIAEVLQKGYKKGDKIIRYAMVKVAN